MIYVCTAKGGAIMNILEELIPEILRTFVSKITIHENDKDTTGAKYEIDKFLTHIGKFR